MKRPDIWMGILPKLGYSDSSVAENILFYATACAVFIVIALILIAALTDNP